MNKKIVIASDSFKGTLPSIEICNIFKEELKDKDIDATYIPIADGGEGSLIAISSFIKGRFIKIKSKNLYFEDIESCFYLDENNNAYLETATVAGIGLMHKDNDPGKVTTFGLGEQVKEAIKLGAKNIYFFLGGSATNDGGVGVASALGTKFFDENTNEFIPTGLTLNRINHIENSYTINLLKNINVFALTDVDSPLYGTEGAAYKFAPQKGATIEEVKLLDKGLIHLSSLIKRDLNIDVSNIKGAGAAGGLGAGLYAFLNAKISSGINTILDLISFDEIIKNNDLVISGEGKLDYQTFDGKVIDGIANRCNKYHKSLDLIVGISLINKVDLQEKYPSLAHINETNEEHKPFEEIKNKAKEDYIKAVRKLIANL